MDPKNFDALVRTLGAGASRRFALRAALAGLIAPLLPGIAETDAKPDKRKRRGKKQNRKKQGSESATGENRAGGACRKAGHPCEGNQRCCEHLVCIVSGPGEAERCTPCGAVGKPCCDDEACGSGAICQDGECFGCGTAGQPCCDGETCDEESICDSVTGQCTACGDEDQPCCANDSCDDGFDCAEGSCVACGDDGQACCDDGPDCDAGLVCSQGNQCVACGGDDQPCCAENSCDGGFVCDADSGECVACGNDGQACCADDGPPCAGDLICDNDGVCGVGCGDQGEACCADGACGENLVCNEGTCASSCDIGDVVCVINGNGQCVPGVCCEEGDGPGCAEDQVCIAGGCIEPNQFRVVLIWGADPADLDSHLWLPPESPYHVFWSDKGTLAGVPNAELDIDDITGFGPETITISALEEGTYVYAVHHYRGATTIGASGAVVKLYQGPNLLRTYTAPATDWDGQPEDPFNPYNDGVIWWQVFELNYDGTTATITDINAASNDSFIPYGNPGPFALRSLGAEVPLKSRVTGGNTARRRSRKGKNRRRARR